MSVPNDTYVVKIDKIDSKYKNILIKFKDEQICREIIIENPYSRLCGVGLLGDAVSTDSNGNIKKSYNTWRSMIHRCYNPKEAKRAPTYQDCFVCDEWIYYSHFEQWWNENYYEIDNQDMQLDKDILVKGSKIYSPQNCVIVPRDINMLFVKRGSKRGNLPIGVSFFKRDQKYMASVAKYGKQNYIGLYDTPEEAFEAYKQAKEQHIKQVADEYKEKIPQKLYEALYKWEVDIND